MRSSNRRVSTLAVVLAVGFGGAVSGCGLVVGSGDYVVGTVDGGGSTGGSDASQTIPPAGDGAAPGSDATAPPDAAGSPPPTEAGTTADGGPTSVCANGALVPGGLPTGDPAFQQLVNACVLAVSCDPLFFDVPVSDCINRDYLDTFFPDKCLAGIKSGASGPCDDYYACEGSRIAAPSECSEASTADTDIGTCNAGIATSCLGSGDGIIFNCGALGGTCTTYHESDYADFGDTAAGCQNPQQLHGPDGQLVALRDVVAALHLRGNGHLRHARDRPDVPRGLDLPDEQRKHRLLRLRTVMHRCGNQLRQRGAHDLRRSHLGQSAVHDHLRRGWPRVQRHPGRVRGAGVFGLRRDVQRREPPDVHRRRALHGRLHGARIQHLRHRHVQQHDLQLLRVSVGAARRCRAAHASRDSSLYGPTFVTVPLFTSVATQSVSWTEAASPPPAIRVSKLAPPSVV